MSVPFTFTPEQTKAIYLTALRVWGSTAQAFMCVEEAGEFLSALNKFRRKRITHQTLCEKIADLQVVLEQLVDVLDQTYPVTFQQAAHTKTPAADLIATIRNDKLARLSDKLNQVINIDPE